MSFICLISNNDSRVISRLWGMYTARMVLPWRQRVEPHFLTVNMDDDPDSEFELRTFNMTKRCFLFASPSAPPLM